MDNNNADFDATVNEVHPTLAPAPDMTREEFVEKAAELLESMKVDHEEYTGVTDVETHGWDYWIDQLTAAYVNES